MIAAKAETLGLWAALDVGVEQGRTGEETPPIPLLRPFDYAQGERNAPLRGVMGGKEARVGGRAVGYRSAETGLM